MKYFICGLQMHRLKYDPPQQLIIATGDGNQGEFGTSFDEQVGRALKRGWDVEVWSWQAQLSGRFSGIRLPSGAAPEIMLLDEHYKSITFVRGGNYYFNGTMTDIPERIVSPPDWN